MEGLEGIIYLAIIAFMFGGGFGGFGFGGNGVGAAMAGNMATQNDVQRGFDNVNQQNNQRDILAAVTAQGQMGVAATNQTFHDNLAAMQSLYNETARDIAALAVGQANLAGSQAKCCCEIKQLISESKYDTNMRMMEMEQRLTAKMDANTIQELRDKVYKLEMGQAMTGVVRYPMGQTYTAGYWPPAAATGTTG